MSRIISSVGNRALVVIEEALKTGKNTSSVQKDLAILSKKINSLDSFIRCYKLTEDEAFDTDDEIINWTIVDVIDDLSAALWNLATGFYKTSASTLRGALEMAAVSLYFQRLENEQPVEGAYNKAFSEWDGGLTSTPNWGTTKPKLSNHPLARRFKSENGFCVIEDAYDHFKYLCSFTHSRARSPEDGEGSNSMNMQNQVGEFHATEFERFKKALETTIAHIASIWAVTYPHTVAEWREGGDERAFVSLDEIFSTKNAATVLKFSHEINAT
ncbi:hypothetical protein TW78_19500 [Vibrio coralliilyticus]|uniref:Uncharacterized protein n=1 Tax=Vibrio coralliilyticus TaxID=190893 RepID=A0A837G7W4_9VIBR|nr:hypothetical protein [Vibrio coralliilyticus]KJY69522.1 hypothetical protein TW78_19500 [Vibrio coralliilyticus]QOU32839.1 hypothetical protein TW71_018550 [Vibrio coralliilyticus]